MDRVEYVKILGDKIRQIRINRELSQEELAKRCGYKSRSTINKIESGAIEAPQTKLTVIAKALNVDLQDILPYISNDNMNATSAIKIPILGNVIAGVPIKAIEEIIGWEEITPKMASTGEYFALKTKGDSMAPHITEGDIIIVKKQSDANSGDIVVVCVNGDEATCKKLIKHKDGISLMSFNPNYEPMYFSSAEVISKPIAIIGRVVELRRRF